MKKLLLLFTLLLLVCSGAWADPTATLINQSTGAVNSTEFRCTSTTSTKSGGYTISTYGTYEKYIQLGGAYTTPIGTYETNKIVQYDAKTNSVTVDVYAFNKASSTNYMLYISMIEEGDTKATDIDIQEFTVNQNSGDKFSYTFTPTTNATIYVHVGNNSNVHICQVEVTDNGATALKQAGEVGYTANLSLCRLGWYKSNSTHTTTLDGLGFNITNNNVKVLNSDNPVKLKATSEYIKFTLAETERVIINASGTYSVTTNDTYQSGSSVSGNQDIILDAGTYYICPNGSNVTFASLSFLAPPSLYTVTYNLNGGTGTTPSESDKAEGAKFTLHNGTTGITAPTGKEFSKWVDQDDNEFDGGEEYTMPGKDVTLTAQWVNLKCAKPTVTISDFNFENKKYVISVTNNEAGSTLKVSTDGGSSWSDATTSYDVTSTATYKFKSVKDSYDDSDVATASITHDSSKKNIAWVHGTDGNYSGYNADEDPMVIALKMVYNVIPVGSKNDTAPKADLSNADLIVCTEAMTGNTTFSNGMKDLLDGTTPMIGLKFFNYTSGRWGWGAPANPGSTTLGFTANANYKVLDGVTFEDDGTIKLATAKGTSNNVVQTANFNGENKPADNVILGTLGSDDEKAVMHYSATNKYFGLGLSVDCRANYTENAKTLIKNAAAMLIANEDLTTEVATVSGTITEAGWNTFSSTYPLDLSTISGGTAYVATTKDNENVTLTETTAIVEAGEGLMIKGTAGATFTISTTTDAATLTRDNLLVGLPTGGTVAANNDNYVFAWQTGYVSSTAGFYFVNDAEPTLGAGKAYLHAEGVTPAKLGIIIDDSETDGIKSVQGSRFTVNGEAYNLAGQKVGKDYKGIVIVNGKKIVRK